MSQRRKVFKAGEPIDLSRAESASAIVHVPVNAATTRLIDLSEWLGRGIDIWVLTCAGQLKAFIVNEELALASVVAYGKAIKYFFQYLTVCRQPVTMQELVPMHVQEYVIWLKNQSRLGGVSKRNIYTHTKAVLIGLLEHGLIVNHEALFPSNPFPFASAQKNGQSALSTTERSRLADALRSDIIELHAGRFTGVGSQALCVYALALALRTGLNTTSLLELDRDCLGPHPFMPRMRLLRAFKRRGNATHIKILRYNKLLAVPTPVAMDGVALFEEVLRRTQPLAEEAHEDQRDYLWLYRCENMRSPGKICRLSSSDFTYNISTFVRRHQLLGDDGLPLSLNTSRLRKTMENRLWCLSNGDLFTVAVVMGHTTTVADQSYLAVTDAMRRDAVFVGETLPGTYRGTKLSDGKNHRLEATPVGRCVDTLNGERAPGNGSHCVDFLSCFTCRSFAIVGARDDLYRLFSFYWFLEAEARSARSSAWAEQLLIVRTQIDVFTLDKFDETLVEEAKEAARVKPLKFWSQHHHISG